MTNGFSQCIEQTPSSGWLSPILRWLQHSTGLLTDELQAPSERLLHPLRYATFHPTLAAPIAQRLIGIRCFRLIKYTWLGGRGRKIIAPTNSTSLWSRVLSYLSKFTSCFPSLPQCALRPTIEQKYTICSVRQFVRCERETMFSVLGFVDCFLLFLRNYTHKTEKFAQKYEF